MNLTIKSEYDVREFGAVGDGVTINTDKIQNAIDECSKNGGGYVVFSKGHYISGTIKLKNNVYLKIDISAKLIASGSLLDYDKDVHYNRYVNETHLDRCFIYAENAQNIGLVGDGEINGNATMFPNEGEKNLNRPMMIRFLNCNNIKVGGLKLFDAASWTTAFLDCSDIWAQDLDIRALVHLNGDGLDFDGCENVFVTRCKIRGTDDNICLQAHKKDRAMKNVFISDCLMSSTCDNIRIGMKSVGDIFNVQINNCTFENTWREGVKIESSEGGSISDIMVSNIIMRNVRRPIYIIANNLIASVGIKEIPPIGQIQNISFKNIKITDTKEMLNTHFYMWNGVKCIMGEPKFGGMRIDAEENHKIYNLTLEEIDYLALGGVKLSDIPPLDDYPKVVDARFEDTSNTAANYYPDWNRACFLDVRNVDGLKISSLNFKTINDDEREKMIIENCTSK